jgi:hypothetical protein
MPVKIKGKEYPIEVTMWALLQFKRDKGKAVSELKDDDQEDMVYYSYLCVKGACMRAQIDFKMSFEDYILYVEGDPLEALLLSKIGEEKKKRDGKP